MSSDQQALPGCGRVLRDLLSFVKDSLTREWAGGEGGVQDIFLLRDVSKMMSRTGITAELNEQVLKVAEDIACKWKAAACQPTALSGALSVELGRLLERMSGEQTASWLAASAVRDVRLLVCGILIVPALAKRLLEQECVDAVLRADGAVIAALWDLHLHSVACSESRSPKQQIKFEFPAAFGKAIGQALRTTVASHFGPNADSPSENAAQQPQNSGELLHAICGFFRSIDGALTCGANLMQKQHGREVLLVDLKLAVVSGAKQALSHLAEPLASAIHYGMCQRQSHELAEILDFITYVSPCIEACDRFAHTVVIGAQNRLLELDVHLDDEREVLCHLRQKMTQCTAEWRNLHVMLRDVEMRSEMDLPCDSVSAGQSPSHQQAALKVSLVLLGANAWSLHKDVLCHLHRPIQAAKDHLEKLYDQHHKKLRWNMMKSSAILRTLYLQNNVEIVLPSAACAILLEFDAGNSDTINADGLNRVTDLKHPQVVTVVRRLCKIKLLNEAPVCDDSSSNSIRPLLLNRKCQLPQKKISLLPKHQQSSAKERVLVPDQQQADQRRHVLQAAVVRLMKSTRTLLFAQILEQVQNLVRGIFVATAPEVKKCVEDLVEREWLVRDASDRDRFTYVS